MRAASESERLVRELNASRSLSEQPDLRMSALSKKSAAGVEWELFGLRSGGTPLPPSFARMGAFRRLWLSLAESLRAMATPASAIKAVLTWLNLKARRNA